MNNDITQHITLELSRPTSKSIVAVKKNDTNSRRVQVTLTNNGGMVNLQEVVIAVVKGIKPDGNVFYNDCTIVGDTIWFVVTTQMINVNGDVPCELEITWKDETTLTTPTFNIHVYDTLNTGEESLNEYKAATQILADTINNREKSEQYVKDAEAKAELSREYMESSRDSAGESGDFSKLSESYAKGGTGTRGGEDYDNAKYYYEMARDITAVDIATTERAGIVKPDGESILVGPDGTIKVDMEKKADLDENGKVPAAQLPSYVDDVVEYASKEMFPATGESGIIYVAIDTNLAYRWSGSSYAEISPSLALGETSSTAYAGDKGKANAEAIANVAIQVNTNTADIEELKAGGGSQGDGIVSIEYTDWLALPEEKRNKGSYAVKHYPTGMSVGEVNDRVNIVDGRVDTLSDQLSGIGEIFETTEVLKTSLTANQNNNVMKLHLPKGTYIVEYQFRGNSSKGLISISGKAATCSDGTVDYISTTAIIDLQQEGDVIGIMYPLQACNMQTGNYLKAIRIK